MFIVGNRVQSPNYPKSYPLISMYPSIYPSIYSLSKREFTWAPGYIQS